MAQQLYLKGYVKIDDVINQFFPEIVLKRNDDYEAINKAIYSFEQLRRQRH